MIKGLKKKYWDDKTYWKRFSDLAFIILIIALLFPQGRMAIGGFVNSIKAKLTNPSLLEAKDKTIIKDYSWTLETNASEINLKQFEGKVIFVNLWATWCPPCVGEMPEIEKLYKHYESNDQIEFLMVSNESNKIINRFINKHKYTFPVYTSKSVGPNEFTTQSIPTTFVISKDGEIVIRETGAANWGGKKMIAIIDKLILHKD